MKTIIDIDFLRLDLNHFGVTSDDEISYILKDLPTGRETLEESKIANLNVGLLAVIRYGQGNPANPIAVYIESLADREINVAYTRSASGSSPYYGGLKLKPSEKYFVGYHCITGSYTNLCSVNITTVITYTSYV